MKENEEITNLERFELLIEDGKEHRELYGEFSVGEYDIEIMQHILSDYKRVLKENEELNLKYYMLYTGKIENLKAQEVKIKSQVIPVQKVKDKIEEYKKMLLSCNRFSDVDRIKAINERILELQELLEGRK